MDVMWLPSEIRYSFMPCLHYGSGSSYGTMALTCLKHRTGSETIFHLFWRIDVIIKASPNHAQKRHDVKVQPLTGHVWWIGSPAPQCKLCISPWIGAKITTSQRRWIIFVIDIVTKKMCFQLPSKRAHAATISCGNAEQIADFHSSTYSEPMQRDTEAKTTLQSIPFSKL